jgi:hypothetical protein
VEFILSCNPPKCSPSRDKTYRKRLTKMQQSCEAVLNANGAHFDKNAWTIKVGNATHDVPRHPHMGVVISSAINAVVGVGVCLPLHIQYTPGDYVVASGQPRPEDGAEAYYADLEIGKEDDKAVTRTDWGALYDEGPGALIGDDGSYRNLDGIVYLRYEGAPGLIKNFADANGLQIADKATVIAYGNYRGAGVGMPPPLTRPDLFRRFQVPPPHGLEQQEAFDAAIDGARQALNYDPPPRSEASVSPGGEGPPRRAVDAYNVFADLHKKIGDLKMRPDGQMRMPAQDFQKYVQSSSKVQYYAGLAGSIARSHAAQVKAALVRRLMDEKSVPVWRAVIMCHRQAQGDINIFCRLLRTVFEVARISADGRLWDASDKQMPNFDFNDEDYEDM